MITNDYKLNIRLDYMSCEASIVTVYQGKKICVTDLLNYLYFSFKRIGSLQTTIPIDQLKSMYDGLLSVGTEQQLIEQFVGPILLGFFSLSRGDVSPISLDFGNISGAVKVNRDTSTIVVPLLAMVTDFAKLITAAAPGYGTVLVNLDFVFNDDVIDANTGKKISADRNVGKLILNQFGVPQRLDNIKLPGCGVPITVQLFVFKTDSVGLIITEGKFIIGVALVTDFYGETFRYFVIIDRVCNRVVTQFGDEVVRLGINCQLLDFTPSVNNTNLNFIDVIPGNPQISTVSRSGDVVSISGLGFTNVTSVNVGGIQAQILSVSDDVLTVQAFSSGDDVGVTMLLGSASSSTQGSATPIAPRNGSTNIITVVISPTIPQTLKSVELLGKPIDSIRIIPSATELIYQFQAPPYTGTESQVNITTTTTDVAFGNTYKTPLQYGPFITQVDSSATPNIEITIEGFGFDHGPVSVCFGEICVAATVVSDTVIRAVVPLSSGTVDLTVSNDYGVSPPVNFTFLTPFIVRADPNSARITDTITLIGTEFDFPPVTVCFGDSCTTQLTVVDNNTVNVVVPNGTGTVPLVLSNSIGSSPPTVNFTYVTPVITNINPNPGKAGNLFTLSGTNLVPGTSDTIIVRFGNAVVTNPIASGQNVQGSIPAGSGTVNVTLTNKFGTSPPVSFTYS